MRDHGFRLRGFLVRAAVALMVLLAAVCSADAQSAPTFSTYPEAPPLLTAAEARARLDVQRRFMADLQREAWARAPNDPVRQQAILREGMGWIEQRMLQAAIEGNERSFGERSTRAPLAFNDLRGDTRDDGSGRPIEAEFMQPRISGGTQVRPGQLPAVVALRKLTTGRCTGVRIASNTVLTAAHCFCSGGQRSPFSGEVVFGTSDASSTRLPIQGGSFLQQSFCAAPRNGHDLAVVHFQGAMAGDVAVIMDPVFDYLYSAPRRLVVAGFGRTGGSGSPQGVKLMASVEISSRLCAGANDCLPGRELKLIDPTGVRDTCPGDSGGGAFHVEGGWFLSGITSRGVRSQRDCGDGGIYSLVTQAVIRWLCDMNVVPVVHRVDNPCGRAGAAMVSALQRAPDLGVPPPGAGQVQVPMQPASGERPPPDTAGTPPLQNATAPLQQCRATCRPGNGWDCTEQCMCRMLCEAQGEASACQKFCASR